MKLSEVRAKFPMYSDLSDDQLLIGIRNKFYPDIPPQQFYQKIEYDTAAPNPAEGMSGIEQRRAGMGKAITDVLRGAGQLAGVVSREDVAESRKRDAPLMKTGNGLFGNVAGNLGALGVSALLPGAATVPGAALIGAGAGFLQPSASTEETVTNTALGAAIPGAIAAGTRVVPALYQGAKGLVEPLTKSGQERIAAGVLQASATNPAQAAARAAKARELVPGSTPTLAQVAEDPGIAQLERTILNNPEYAPALQQRMAAQRAARMGVVDDVAGTDDYYDAIKEGRRIFAQEDYGKAVKQGIDPAMAETVQPMLDSLMRRPSIQEAQRVAQRIAAEKDQTLTDFGSVEGLHFMKMALDKQINAIKTGNPIGRTDLETLVTTKNDLMATLELVAPAYKEANKNFAQMSGQVNSMDVARSLRDQLQKPGSEYLGGSAKEMGNDYARALSKAKDSVKRQTGMNKSIDQVMAPRDVEALENVARDFGRKSFAENAGKATGSNTAQNLASQNMLRRMLGPTGLPETWAESTMLQGLLSPVQAASKLSGADKRIMDRIAMGLLDPQDAVFLLTAPQMKQGMGLLAAPARRLIPGASAGLLATDY